MVTKRTKKKSVKKNSDTTGKNAAVTEPQPTDDQGKETAKPSASASASKKTSASSKQKQTKKATTKSQSKKSNSSKSKTAKDKKSQSATDKKSRGKKPKKRIWPKVVIAVFVVLILAAISLVVWWRWFLFDDVNDFKDQWIDLNQNVELSITDEQLELTPDVKYAYEVDTFAKKVTYSFSNLSGEASYRFSPDRTKLYLLEGEDSSLFTDLGIFLGFIEEPDYASQSNVIVLMRVSAYEEAERLKQEQELEAQLEQQRQAQIDKEADTPQTSGDDGDSPGTDSSGGETGGSDEPGKTDDPDSGNGGQATDDQGGDSGSGSSGSSDSGSGGSVTDPFGGTLQDRTGPT